MTDYPIVTILMTTYAPAGEVGEKRVFAASTAVSSWRRLLSYDGYIDLHVSDDGSQHEDYGTDVESPPCLWWPQADRRITFSRQERQGLGASLNAGLKTICGHGRDNLIAHFVDDWVLKEPLGLTAWARLLVEDENVGLIRLGPPHPDLTGTVKHLPGVGWGLLLDRHHYAFATRPFLAHQRFFQYYGPFKEQVSALECERDYNERFCAAGGGPSIIYALPDWWEPIEDTHLSELIP